MRWTQEENRRNQAGGEGCSVSERRQEGEDERWKRRRWRERVGLVVRRLVAERECQR